MTPVRITIAALTAFALAAAASSAFAEQAKPRATDTYVARGDFAAQSNLGALAPRRTLQWDARKGRWGLKLDVDQPTDRDLQGKDMAFGLTYRVTRGLRVGPSVSLGDDTPQNLRKVEPQQPAPRVRLETTFKF
ncbi:MAG TPA: hypothetical protein VFE03_03745 [Caulobacteraceae bacterium]|jgi:hypothetical protein|nr:hypothetical protein [Caulobacteraceae bacterium]